MLYFFGCYQRNIRKNNSKIFQKKELQYIKKQLIKQTNQSNLSVKYHYISLVSPNSDNVQDIALGF